MKVDKFFTFIFNILPSVRFTFFYFSEKTKMSIAGSWKKVKVDNGLKFGKAIGATDEQLAKQAQATSTVVYEITGNHVKVTRVHSIGGNDLVK